MSETVFTLAARLGDEDGDEERTTAEHSADEKRTTAEHSADESERAPEREPVAGDGARTPDEQTETARQTAADALETARELAEGDEPTRAAHYYSKVVDRDPTNATAHREYAALLARTGYREGATRHYERALDLDPDPDLRAEYDAFCERHDPDADARSDGGPEQADDRPDRESDGGVVAGIALKDDAELRNR